MKLPLWRRSGESDLRLGTRLALLGPLLFYILVVLLLIVARVDGESGEGFFYAYWLFIGAAQCIYLGPAIILSVARKRPQIAWGLARGGGIIAGVNAVAWGVGLYIGAR